MGIDEAPLLSSRRPVEPRLPKGVLMMAANFVKIVTAYSLFWLRMQVGISLTMYREYHDKLPTRQG
jgi:hypothetical protein